MVRYKYGDLLTRQEAADYFGVSADFLNFIIDCHLLPLRWQGETPLFEYVSICNFVDRQPRPVRRNQKRPAVCFPPDPWQRAWGR